MPRPASSCSGGAGPALRAAPAAGRPLRVEYLTVAELAQLRARGFDDVLGIAALADTGVGLDAADVPVACVALPALGAAPAPGEVWRAAGPLRSGRIGRVHYRSSGALTFGCVAFDEHDGAALEEVTARAYAEMFACLDALGHRHAVRIWNYLPRINDAVEGVERYRLFNEARQRAFRARGREVRGNVPAACALGTPAGGPLTIYFLAGAEPAVAIENPRQVSAYDYPPEYGRFSPTFSRATLLATAGGPTLFVSGTASIVGHLTVHPGDVVAQTRETVANLRALVAEANRVAGGRLFLPERLRYKVYVRRAADLGSVAAEFAARVHPAAPVLYLGAEICRADLLVEIEAVGESDPARVG